MRITSNLKRYKHASPAAELPDNATNMLNHDTQTPGPQAATEISEL